MCAILPLIGGIGDERLTGDDFRALAQCAWREYQRTKGRSRIVDGIHDTPTAPRWFVTCELGEGECSCGRCLSDPEARLTLSFLRWRETNADALLELFGSGPPPLSAQNDVASVRRGDRFDDVVAAAHARLAEAL